MHAVARKPCTASSHSYLCHLYSTAPWPDQRTFVPHHVTALTGAMLCIASSTGRVIVMAIVLDRVVIMPPAMNHGALAYGTCSPSGRSRKINNERAIYHATMRNKATSIYHAHKGQSALFLFDAARTQGIVEMVGWKDWHNACGKSYLGKKHEWAVNHHCTDAHEWKLPLSYDWMYDMMHTPGSTVTDMRAKLRTHRAQQSSGTAISTPAAADNWKGSTNIENPAWKESLTALAKVRPLWATRVTLYFVFY